MLLHFFPLKGLLAVIPPGLRWYVKMSRNRSPCRLHNLTHWFRRWRHCGDMRLLGENSWQCADVSATSSWRSCAWHTPGPSAACDLSLHNSCDAWHGEIHVWMCSRADTRPRRKYTLGAHSLHMHVQLFTAPAHTKAKMFWVGVYSVYLTDLQLSRLKKKKKSTGRELPSVVISKQHSVDDHELRGP